MEKKEINSLLNESLAFLIENQAEPKDRKMNIVNTDFGDDAKQMFISAMYYFCGGEQNTKFVKEYGKVVEWLKQNNGKSLLLRGKCGTGKTLIACKVIPLMYGTRKKIVRPVNARTFAKQSRVEKLWKEIPFVVDDLGCEGIVKHYGTEVDNFAELIETLEYDGGLCVITTNLTTEQIAERYGERIFDRIRTLFEMVDFDFNSFRQ